VREATSAASVSPVDVATFVVKARSAYIASGKHMIDKVQLTSSGLLKQLTCLQPGNRTKTSSTDYTAKLCDALPLSIRSDQVKDECKLMQLEQEEPERGVSDGVRIEKHWKHFTTLKDPKYPSVSMVIKARLSLSHGTADVEQGFSKSGCILTDTNTAMTLKMLNARLSVCGGMLVYDRKPHLVPVTR